MVVGGQDFRMAVWLLVKVFQIGLVVGVIHLLFRAFVS